MSEINNKNNDLPKTEVSELPALKVPSSPAELGTFADRLKHIIGKQSVRSFASACNLSDGVVRQYLSGKTEPGLGALLNIARMADVSVGWLATGKGEIRTGEGKQSEVDGVVAEQQVPFGKDGGFVLIPRYEVAASAGGGAVIHSEQIVDYLSFKSEWIRNGLGLSEKDLALINVKGDSMEPTLSNEDLILIDMRSRQVEDNAVYVLQFHGTLLVKRIQRKLDGSVVVRSDNTIYEPEVVSGEMLDTLHVVGRVVWCGRRM